MSVATHSPEAVAPNRSRRTGWMLIGGSVALLVGAGLLLWRSQGDAVFGETVLNALAWCF